MEKAQEILFHIEELYTENPSEEKIIQACEKNQTRYQAWVDAFNGYDLSDVLSAIDNFWEFKNSKTKPNVAQIKAILNAHKTEKTTETREGEFNALSPAIQRMESDIESGNCHHLLPVYEEAVKYILTDKLIDLVGVSEWRNMDYSKRYQTAKNNGLFDDFDMTLRGVCLKNYGKEEQFQSENDLINASGYHYSARDEIKTLASHWGLD